jgi:hypothetical protein
MKYDLYGAYLSCNVTITRVVFASRVSKHIQITLEHMSSF